MSYRKKHIKHKIGRIKPKKSVFKKIWFWILALIIVVFFSTTYFVLFYSGLQIKNIEVSGNRKINTQDLQKFVLEDASSKLFSFWKINITSRSILLANQTKLNGDILNKFSGIEKVKIGKNFPQTLKLVVSERNAIGAYCNAAEHCWLIDESGTIFEPLAVNPGSDITIIRQLADSRTIYIGEKVLDKNVVGSIFQIQMNLIDDLGIRATEAIITSPVRLNILTSEGWQVYFDLEDGSDMGAQLTKLNVLLNGQISDASRKNLRYIDLRPKDRAIICDNKTCGN